MEVKAKARYIRISPKKVRLVLDVIRGMDAEEAEKQLKFLGKAATGPIAKLLNSAVANAINNFGLEKSNLKIKQIIVDEGPTLKRWKPRAMGRAMPIRKRTSHIKIVLEEKVPSKEVKKKTEEVEAPVKIEELAKMKKQKETEGTEEIRKQKDEEKEIKITETGELREKKKDKEEFKHLEQLRKKQEKGFFRRIFRRKAN